MTPLISRILAVAALALVPAVASPAQGIARAPAPREVIAEHACAAPTRPSEMACLAMVRTDVTARSGIQPQAAPAGVTPADIRKAYALPVTTAGAGQTVAVVDAYDDPKAEADLATYRSQYGLPPCTTANGCFRKVGQTGTGGLPKPDTGWAEEESLDLDMVSAACPLCHILLVEADSSSISSLGAAVGTAIGLGARFVSNSYGGAETAKDATTDATYFHHPGVAITVASGDSGYGLSYPATSQYVTAVSGTSLSKASNARGWKETAWTGGGSGCSAYQPKPAWQRDDGCAKRSVADVAAVADPGTGVSVYDSYEKGGWLVIGGTSASAPIIAGVYALAGRPADGSYPASFPYAHAGALNDVTGGENGSCTPNYLCRSRAGYDGPTGLGTPNGVAGFRGGGTTSPLKAG